MQLLKPLLFATLLSSAVIANDEDSAGSCEMEYDICIEKCDANDNDSENCYEKCEIQNEKCNTDKEEEH